MTATTRSRVEDLDGLFGLTAQNGDCLEWTGPRNSDGYGIVRFAGRVWSTHRLAYSLANKVDLIPTQHVCHECDNPPCINPDHLWLGDVRANMRDAVHKGRSGRAKLTPEQVREIRMEHFAIGRGRHARSNTTELAQRFGVCRETIQLVASNKTWTIA